MSLITRCTACGTTFKVVPDLLKISQGWARCGSCGEVFDAEAQLVGEGASQPLPVPSQAGAPLLESNFQQQEFHAASIDPVEPILETAALIADELPPPPDNASDMPTDSVTETSPELVAETLNHELELDETEHPSEIPAATQPESHEDVSFVRDARRRAFWSGPLVRTALVLIALLAVLVGAFQFAFSERDRIVAMEPRARPVIQAICEQLGCRIGPLKQIDSFVIDSSTFAAAGTNLYKLSVGLRNTANIPLAMPSIELTLTDVQDQAVVRRVLSPAELGAPQALTARADWSGSISLAVAATDGPRISGYRVLAFYP